MFSLFWMYDYEMRSLSARRSRVAMASNFSKALMIVTRTRKAKLKDNSKGAKILLRDVQSEVIIKRINLHGQHKWTF